jgi:exonuclease SbcC
MIRRIVLENFMSHVRTEIEPARGLTVLIGPNNCGKSAVVSALQTLCSNIPGDFMLRHGAKECSVTMETDDGHSVTWRRKKSGTVSYLIDGREVPRAVTPDDLHEVLRLPKVVSDDGKDQFDIHFGSQKSPIFLLDETERRAALFFASSSDAEYLMRMQKRHQEKVREAKRDRDKVKERLEKLDAELTCLEPIAELATAMQAVADQHSTLEHQQQLCQRFSRDVDQLTAQHNVLTRQSAEFRCLNPLKAPPAVSATEPLQDLIALLLTTDSQRQMELSRTGVLVQLPGPPALVDIEPLERTLQQLAEAARILGTERRRAAATEQLTTPPALSDTLTLQTLCDLISSSARQASQLDEHVSCLQPLRSAPDPIDTAALERLLSELSTAADSVERTARSHELLQNLVDPPTPREKEPLRQLLAECDKSLDNIATCDAEVGRLNDEMQSVLAAVRKWTAANPVCPTCGAEVDAERLMTWGHAHG